MLALASPPFRFFLGLNRIEIAMGFRPGFGEAERVGGIVTTEAKFVRGKLIELIYPAFACCDIRVKSINRSVIAGWDGIERRVRQGKIRIGSNRIKKHQSSLCGVSFQSKNLRSVRPPAPVSS